MKLRRVLIAGLIVTVLAGGTLAVLVLGDGGEEPSGRPAGGQERQRDEHGPGEVREQSPIRFVLADSYAAREHMEVVIENVGTRAYVFQWRYQACFLSYFDSSGRRFIIPPGTHCDILGDETIRPGERKRLFGWSPDECVKDDWGCVESRPLPPGTYTIRGRFQPKTAGSPARVETTFRVVAT
jgi:hypothetical protein